MNEFIIFLAGIIDSIAGGGGLITVPTLNLLLHEPALTIGTNKILGVTSASIALFIYYRGGHLKVRKCLPTFLGIFIGTVFGALTAPYLPPDLFRWALLLFSPVIVFLLLRKEDLIPKSTAFAPEGREHQAENPDRHLYLQLICGLACGFYDGVFGPGGGTFMLLSLLWILKLPLMQAIAVSKLSNSLSAGGSLLTYSATGHVDYKVGLWFAIFIGIGSTLGATFASQNAQKVVKPLLLFVVGLLWLRMAQTLLF